MTIQIKTHETCKLFRCLVCWKLILQDDQLVEHGDGYAHAVCDKEGRLRQLQQIQIERDRQHCEKLLHTAIEYSLQSGRTIEDELAHLIRGEKPKKDKMMCANKGCPHIREMHHKFTIKLDPNDPANNGRKYKEVHGKCYREYCSCMAFRERTGHRKATAALMETS